MPENISKAGPAVQRTGVEELSFGGLELRRPSAVARQIVRRCHAGLDGPGSYVSCHLAVPERPEPVALDLTIQRSDPSASHTGAIEEWISRSAVERLSVTIISWVRLQRELARLFDQA